MNKDALIVKQQLEIEELKRCNSIYKDVCEKVKVHLFRPYMWDVKCPDFPKIAMCGIVKAMQEVE